MYKIFIIISLFFIISCDVIEEPYMVKKNPDTTSTDTSDTVVYIRKVLLEDYTGHRCGNCPRSHEKMQELIGIYGKKIVPISVHVGFFAMPLGAYTADYRTPAGNDLNTFFGNDNAGLPNGMVNRKEWQGEKVLPHSLWQQVIDNILLSKPDLNIELKTTFSTTDKIDINVKMLGLNYITGTYKLSLYLVQDSIVSRQTDYDHSPNDILDYIHRHVMRGAINNTWGDIIALQSISKDENIVRDYTYNLNTSWNYNKCYVIAFVYNEETKEVIQVEEIKIK